MPGLQEFQGDSCQLNREMMQQARPLKRKKRPKDLYQEIILWIGKAKRIVLSLQFSHAFDLQIPGEARLNNAISPIFGLPWA